MNETRKHLLAHARAIRDIELTEAAISLLERVTGSARVISTLRKKQHDHLRRIDDAAELLGAPYGKVRI